MAVEVEYPRTSRILQNLVPPLFVAGPYKRF